MVRNPPSTGPISGPNKAGIVTQTMATTRSRLSMVRTRISRPTGVIMAPPMPSTIRASTNWVSEPRERAADRADHENDDGGAEYGAGAEAVGGPAAHRQEHGERQQIGGDRQLELQRVGADVGGDRRQRGRDDGRIHVLHEQGDRHDQRHDSVGKHATRPSRMSGDEPAKLSGILGGRGKGSHCAAQGSWAAVEPQDLCK